MTKRPVQQLDPDKPVPGSLVFDLQRSHQGYRLNKMCNSLIHADNRARYKADEEAYLAEWNLSERERELVRARDWSGLIEMGGNIYFLLKLGFVVGHGLYRMGAIMRGESLEEFYGGRSGQGAR